jgi:hypothetical protein
MSYGTMLRDRYPEPRDVTVATPEEFVKKFNGTKVIDRVSEQQLLIDRYQIIPSTHLNIVAGAYRQQWNCCCEVYEIRPSLGV